MPVNIGEINTTVDVDSTRGSAGDNAPSPAESVQAQEQMRWQQLVERQQALARRTSAWGFDD